MAKTNIRGSQIADGSSGVDLTVDVTGTLPQAKGGTGVTSLPTVATSGAYSDLSGKPTIPVVSIVTAGTSSSGYPDGLFVEYIP